MLSLETCDQANEEFEKIQSEEEDDQEDTSTYEIITYGADYTLSVLYDKMEKGEILTPGFQRRFVWNMNQASKLIESFLLGLPVPGIFLSKDKKSGKLVVIDGQQRLVTCKAFRDEDFPSVSTSSVKRKFKLKSVNKKWEGKTYSDLEPEDRTNFDDSILRATIIQQIKPEDHNSIYHIFQRLNTGGTVLQNQEIRNCVYNGKFNDMLHELNKDPIWRKLYNSDEPNKRMKDEELILRFLSLYYDFAKYKKPMNEFLSGFMGRNKNPDNATINEMKNLFIETVAFVYNDIGSEAIRPRGNINTAAFDSIMYTLAKYKGNLKENISEQVCLLFEDTNYMKCITEGTTDDETVKSRFNLAKRYLVVE